MSTKTETKKEYFDPRFYGTEQYWIHPMYKEKFRYTDSFKHFMNEYEAHWTLDVIASYVSKYKGYEFVSFFFDTDAVNHTCIFRATDGNKKEIVRQEIEFTTLTVSIKLFYTNNVLMFPSDN